MSKYFVQYLKIQLNGATFVALLLGENDVRYYKT